MAEFTKKGSITIVPNMEHIEIRALKRLEVINMKTHCLARDRERGHMLSQRNNFKGGRRPSDHRFKKIKDKS